MYKHFLKIPEIERRTPGPDFHRGQLSQTQSKLEKGKERLEDDVACLEDLNKNNQNSQYLHFL